MVCQHLIYRNPVNPSGFHRDGCDSAFEEPVHQAVQIICESSKYAHRIAITIWRNGHIHLTCAYVDSRRIRLQDRPILAAHPVFWLSRSLAFAGCFILRLLLFFPSHRYSFSVSHSGRAAKQTYSFKRNRLVGNTASRCQCFGHGTRNHASEWARSTIESTVYFRRRSPQLNGAASRVPSAFWPAASRYHASEEAVPKGEGRAKLPFPPALRQDVPGRPSGPCLRTGKVQSGRAGRGWTDLLGNRIARAGRMAERHQGRPSRQDVSTTAGAAGHDPKDRRRRTATRDSHNKGSGGADSRQAVAGTHL